MKFVYAFAPLLGMNDMLTESEMIAALGISLFSKLYFIEEIKNMKI